MTATKNAILLLLLLICCRSAIAQPTNQDLPTLDEILADLPPGSFQSWRPIRTNASEFVFTDAVENCLGPRLKSIRLEEVVAWAIKCYTSNVPPLVVQEAVVKIQWNDQTNGIHYLLAYMISEGGRYSRKPPWGAASNRPAIPSLKEFDSNPSAEQVAGFIHSSSFGNNEWGVVQVLRIIIYTGEPAVIKAIQSGLSEEEKRKRSLVYPSY